MGKVYYDLFLKGVVSWFVVVWFAIALVMAHRRFEGWLFELRERDVAGPRRRREVQFGEHQYDVTTIVTCAKEDPDVFEEAMSRLRAQRGLRKHAIVVLVDAIDDLKNVDPDDLRCLEIAKRYADRVFVTNVRDKRVNLSNGVRLARENGLLYGRLALMDSDTVCDHDWVVAYLAYEFDDQRIGGATTAQRCLRVVTGPERVSDWLENARLKSSMAAGSRHGQVGCLPGRLYMVRTELVADLIIEELPNEVWTGFRPTFRWPFFERWSVKCKAGDDRQITNFVLRQGYRTVLVLEAGVKTLVPDTYRKLWRTWRRWGTSSQGYVFRTLFGPESWLWRRPFVLYHYATDILISHVSVALVLVWLTSLFRSDEALLLPLSAMVTLSFFGMLATFALRQWPHLREEPRDFLLLPLFVAVVTIAQFVRVWACWTPWRIGTWSTRQGVDDGVSKAYVEEYEST